MSTTNYKFIAKEIRNKALPMLCLLFALFACVLFGGLTSFSGSIVYGYEPYLLIAVLGMWPFIYIATTKYNWLVFLTFSLFGIVQIEPAPVDLLFFTIIPLGLLTGTLSFKQFSGSSSVNSAIWVFVLVTLLSLLVSTELMHSLRYTVITIYGIGIFYFVKMYVQSAEQMRPIMIGYVVGALISVGAVALDYAGLAPPEVFVEQTRARGFFKDSNVFGPFLVPPILFLAEEMWRPALLKKWPVWLKFSCVLILGAGLFFSFSRAAWGNMLITMGLYLLLNMRRLSSKQRLSLIWFGAAAVLTLVVLVIALDMGEFLQYRASVLQGYDSERFDAQFMGMQLGITHLFGIGPGMMDVNGLFAPHSLYVRTFAEHGIFGILSLVVLALFLIVPTGLNAISTNDKIFGLSSSLIFSVSVGLLLNSFLIDTIHWRHFWFVLGLLWLVPLPQVEAGIKVEVDELSIYKQQVS